MRVRSVSMLSTLGWPAWLVSLAGMALLCATTAWWAMTIVTPPAPIGPAPAPQTADGLPDLRRIAHLFGEPANATVAAPSNISVLGVLAAGIRGSAVLSIDGAAPKAFAVGDPIDGQRTIIAVREDAVVIGRDDAHLTLPAPRRPSTALLTAGAAASAGPRPPAPAAVPTRPTPTIPLPQGIMQGGTMQPTTPDAAPADPQGS